MATRTYLPKTTIVRRNEADGNGVVHTYEIMLCLRVMLDSGKAGYLLEDITRGLKRRRHWVNHEQLMSGYTTVQLPTAQVVPDEPATS